MAGKHPSAGKDASLMNHGGVSFVAGNSEQLRAAAEANDLLDQIERVVLVARTKQPEEVVRGWQSKDTSFTAEQALAVGLIDEILP
jgi:ATP-dependent protease ClpP protease subunit